MQWQYTAHQIRILAHGHQLLVDIKHHLDQQTYAQRKEYHE